MADLEDLFRQVNEKAPGKRLELTQNEAVLLDYLFTAHAWDDALLERLQQDFPRRIRREAARVLTGHSDSIVLQPEDLHFLTGLIPPIFPMGTEDAGLNLKRKVYVALYGAPPKPEEKVQENAPVKADPDPENEHREVDVGG